MYDHNEKAGNQGDVVKHPALIAAADALMVECDGAFQYADTFAGYAFNPLRSDGEWHNGIGVLGRSGRTSDNPAVSFWRELWSCRAGLRGSVYPGSSVFILKLCLSKDRSFRARLWDTSPAVVAQLMNAYNTDEAAIHPRPAEVGDFSDVKPNLLLIDPPGLRTQSKKECPDLTDLLRFFNVVDNAILWFPITAQGNGSPAPETEPSRMARSDCLARGLWVTSVRWSGGIRTCGCRLAYRLPSTAGRKLRAAVNDVTALMDWNPDWVTHEGPPLMCGVKTMPAIGKEDIVLTLKALKPAIAARYKAKEIGLFGSFVREQQSNISDIDVLVDFEEGADLFDLVGLALFLEEELQRKVDVVPKSALRVELRESVLREVVPL